MSHVARLLSVVSLLAACNSSTVSDASVDLGGNTIPDMTVVQPTPDLAPACSAATCSGPGQLCQSDKCITDCRQNGSTACGGGTVCDFVTGTCMAPGACVVAAKFESCGSGLAIKQCGPGSQCSPSGACISDGTCTGAVSCDASGRCWASDCSCNRPTASCTPAALTSFNAAPFNGSAWDLKFDSLCNAYVVTLQSGQDFLRQLTPAGTVTSFPGLSNQNMQEVAPAPLPVSATAPGAVALSYGGIALSQVDRANPTVAMPNLVTAALSGGGGALSTDAGYDTGVMGLTYGFDGTLYAANITQQGDYHIIDLAGKKTQSIYTGTRRILTATAFDSTHIALGTLDGEVLLFDTAAKTMASYAKPGVAIASLQRDRFTGTLYAAVGGPPRILAIAPGGSATTFASPTAVGRIALAPNGYLYHVTSLVNANVMFSRYQLPATR